MKFTLVITTFNSEKYIEEAIKSALIQTRKPDEIIISDDNSSDRTIEICTRFIPEVQIVINKNGPSGYVNAYNYALKIGTGDYITILHYDDYLTPEFFQNVERAFNEHPECRFLYVGCNYVNKINVEIKPYPWPKSKEAKRIAGSEYAKKYLKSIINSNHIHRCPGVVINRSLINDGMLFREQAGIINDDDFFLRAGKYTDILGIDFPFASVRLHDESETGKLEKLALQLAGGWHFQYEEYIYGNTILDEECGLLLLSFAFNDLTTALNYSLKNNSDQDVIKIREIMNKLEKLSGKKIENEIRYFYRRHLWYLFKNNKTDKAKLLNKLILSGRGIKSTFK